MFKRVIQRRIEGRFLAGFDDELPKSFARRRRSKFSIAMSSRVSRAGNATILRAAMRTAGLLSDSTHVTPHRGSGKRRTFRSGGCHGQRSQLVCRRCRRSGVYGPLMTPEPGDGDIRCVCRSVCGQVLGRGRLRFGLIRAVSGHRRCCRGSGRSRLWPKCARRWCARTRGIAVTLIEHGQRPMPRVLSKEMSQHFAYAHASAGIRLVFGEAITRSRATTPASAPQSAGAANATLLT